ncbi:MAG: MBL fold metallo-hydrolase [Acidimicrobiales bacterium]
MADGHLSRRTNIGTVSITPVFDGTFTVKAGDLLRPTGDEAAGWARHEELLMGQAKMELPLGAFLVHSSGRTILVDAGVGGVENDAIKGGELVANLGEVGLTCDDITDVLLTHLHFDHIGWVTRRGEVTFPNATVRCHAADWAWFGEGEQADAHVQRKMSPVVDRLELFDSDCVIAPGVTVRHAPGHTPGSTIVVLSSGSERALLLGDVAHCPLELTENDWEGVFDVDPVGARATREHLARELESGADLVAGAHFDDLQFGRLMRVGDRRTWQL